MGDILCAKCGEPWDAYGIRTNDATTYGEGQRILKGEGCPCCKFGTACPTCNGSGFDDDRWPSAAKCDTCHGNRRALAWRYVSGGSPPYSSGKWFHGYRNCNGGPKAVPESAKLLETFDRGQSADGIGEQGWFDCWSCDPATAPKCYACDGTGKLTIDDPAALELEAARSELSASDEEPIGILVRRGLS